MSPQYAGFFLITLGMMAEWATLPLLVMYPIILFMYFRLARREERDMENEFGSSYVEHGRRTRIFIPFVV